MLRAPADGVGYAQVQCRRAGGGLEGDVHSKRWLSVCRIRADGVIFYLLCMKGIDSRIPSDFHGCAAKHLKAP